MKNTNNIQSPLDALLASMTANSNTAAKEQYDIFEDDKNSVAIKQPGKYDGLTESEIWEQLRHKGLLYK